MPGKRSNKQAANHDSRSDQDKDDVGFKPLKLSSQLSDFSDDLGECQEGATYFQKDEIVWAKMRFFSAWPARVSDEYLTISQVQKSFYVTDESYAKKK